MKLGIMQPYFLPYIGYWQLLNAVDKYVIYDDVDFIKGGWINRNRILLNGEPHFLNVPMVGASSNKLINEVGVQNNNKIKKKHLKLIDAAYHKAPQYDNIKPLIESIILQEQDNLAEYLVYSIKKICEYLEIDTELIISSSLNKDTTLKGKDKVISICKLLGADEYYNAIGGKELYSVNEFADQSINLKFLETDKIKYKQFDNIKFVSNLSILDVLMFNETKEVQNYLKKYKMEK